MHPDDYGSFLVRLWYAHQEGNRDHAGHAEVEHIQSGARWSFHTCDALLTFLQRAIHRIQSLDDRRSTIYTRRSAMLRTHIQALLAELLQRRERLTLADAPAPIERISGAVDGGPALLVENLSDTLHSAGIEVKVGAGDTEMRNFGVSATADQQGGIGVIGRGDYGVVGQSPDGVGVMGFGTTGLFGFSNDPEGCGVEGHSASPSGIGVLASAPEPAITALAIDTGNIRVPGAGEQTPTPVFVHVAAESNTRGNQSVIDHPMTNDDPKAILIVTRHDRLLFSQDEDSPLPLPHGESFSVAYSSRAAKWLIVQRAGSNVPVGAAFNVLVFKV
jgi:hypothetical protein